MKATNPLISRQSFMAGWVVASALLLASCGPAPAPVGINDPNEAQNREIHAFNKAVDKTILKPLSGGGKLIPKPVKTGLSNVAANLSAPGEFVNHLLQGRLDQAAVKTLRFALNTTVGVGGLFDPATALGVPRKTTDFGETLYVWGLPEGAYAEVPLIGPTTDRDLAGKLVDLALNPLGHVLTADGRKAAAGVKLASRLGDRAAYSDTIDAILYDSADSYAQARLLYLQNRRFTLGQTTGGQADGASADGSSADSFVDPYEDPYGN
jgi:phospholipid-binding lipoprotein MlaA